MVNKLKSIAIGAGEILLRHFKKPKKYATKNGRYDYLTDADTETNNYIVQKIIEAFPADRVLSEEGSTSYDGRGRWWLVDPLDGTKNFIRDNDGFCVVIGLCIDGNPEFGLVFSPVRNLLYYAQKGKGAFMQRDSSVSKLSVSMTGMISTSHMTVADHAGEPRPLIGLEKSFKVLRKSTEGSTGLKLAKVASGDADFFMVTHYKMGKWDTCGGQVILEEAGGKVTNLHGETLNYRSKNALWNDTIIASNSKLHDQLLSHIRLFFKYNGSFPK
ncbi:MAG: inositol monophosphatase [Patescibacteria group bacterium]